MYLFNKRVFSLSQFHRYFIHLNFKTRNYTWIILEDRFNICTFPKPEDKNLIFIRKKNINWIFRRIYENIYGGKWKQGGWVWRNGETDGEEVEINHFQDRSRKRQSGIPWKKVLYPEKRFRGCRELFTGIPRTLRESRVLVLESWTRLASREI